ncbi:hypothetical protein Nos7524_4827 [Nostoc sp. PCC 7524]|uniref:hypothetical protein n=1 Tax=Nostoc sp. (strain ATCC 29411 / PCC 7524) TaxID=28072 RepID=UPI00029EF124|nr:hypothetical protein [Nostoc sp. PCC 7524]AFY50564.1 hypothetical protein Nos7524_4827 [Nostoc sp. PCC 7524]
MTQPNLINQAEASHISEASCLTEILQEIQETPQEYWSNLLEIMRVFRKSVTIKPELLTNFEQEDLDIQTKKLLHQQHQALKELTKEWLQAGDEREQTETWEYLNQAIDDNPF